MRNRRRLAIGLAAAAATVVATPGSLAAQLVGTWNVTPNPQAPWSEKGHVVTIRESSAAEAGPYMQSSAFNAQENPQVGTYPNYHGAYCDKDTEHPDDHTGYTFYAFAYDWLGGGTLYGCTANPSAGVAFYTGQRYLTLSNFPDHLGGSWYEGHFNDPKASRSIDLRQGATPGGSSGAEPPAERTYPAPAPGGTKTLPGPKLGRRDDNFTGVISFVDDSGNPASGPTDEEIAATGTAAQKICMVLFDVDSADFRALDNAVGSTGLHKLACLHIVSAILARADAIKRKRLGQKPTARAAGATRCLVVASPAARKLLRATCRDTAKGTRLTIRPRRRGTTLAKILGRKPKVRVGRGKTSTPKAAKLTLSFSSH
jgi:hypothetical protein